MTTKLIQKDLFKGSQEFELVDDHVNVRIKAPFKKEETLTVMLTVLDPEPVISKSLLHFKSRVNGESLISLYLEKPNTEEFNAFVSALKQRAFEEFNAFAGLQSTRMPTGESPNAFEEPPEFDDPDQNRLKRNLKHINVAKIDDAIQMLNTHLESEQTAPLISALEKLKEEPENEHRLEQVLHAFNELGPNQGAVLTYAPYVSILLYDDPFSNQ
ncbi:hypothetical protein [Solemya velesiana gill symbiont]|uniref:Uncharacterized protein n=1 Tax=Solemya velesiana gill symbiont TaxID=1918948 RepID=A0A1T2KS60_9GAMM|nr:hypothetical protein [Solemya velesiana gill symbiont]OOZ35695.1 hypothetical protein BOW51_10725 [Solemya velesiana gill symbiont]